MNLYLLKRIGAPDYVSRDVLVIAAESEDAARALCREGCASECLHSHLTKFARPGEPSCRWLEPAFASCALLATTATVPAGVVLAA